MARKKSELEQVKGIGPEITKALNTLGVMSLRDLVGRDAKAVADALDGSGRGQVERWQEQAQRLLELRGDSNWLATFVREVGRPAMAAEVDGRLYQRGKAERVDQATKERLEALSNLQFSFEEV